MKRVLFVDDEPHVLEALRRMFRTHRHVWDMTFVTSGRAALEALKSEPFDVVVSDMRMPEMDGAKLLEAVQRESPRTVRIVLSGHSDLEAVMRSVRVSHQYLAKPCDAALLTEVVERACNLESLLSDATLKEILGDINELPVLPRTYQSLMTALDDPEIDLGKIGEIVEEDQATTSKILQLVNSSYFGLRHEVKSVRQAASYLGVRTIRHLVLTTEVFRQFAGHRVSGFSLEEQQQHALLTGRLARRLLPDSSRADEAFVAGMLHDIGTLVLAAYLPTRLGEACARAREAAAAGEPMPVHEAERSVLGVSHAEIGAYLLGLWGMPYPIVEAVAYHHTPSSVAEESGLGVLAAVHVADALAREVRPGGATKPRLDEAFLERLGVTDRVPEWLAIAEEEASDGRAAA